jgi:hypothetical protein
LSSHQIHFLIARFPIQKIINFKKQKNIPKRGIFWIAAHNRPDAAFAGK